MTITQYKQATKKNRSKYNNKKTVVDGITFDSKMEARYYEQLKWLKQAKQIKDFELQPKFLLQDAFEKDGKKYRKIEYVADFKIHNLDGSVEIIDVKGTKTQVFAMKEKMFHAKYPHKLSVVSYDRSRGWTEI